jgi:hypothetical protein
MKPTIAIFMNPPECSPDCVIGMIQALSLDYRIKIFTKSECNFITLINVDIVAFPGGLGDADSFDDLLKPNKDVIIDYVRNGGRYLGICMGAYWAGRNYFDILDGIEAEQYIKRTTADIHRPFGTTARVMWNGKPERMYFYDGTAFIGDPAKFTTIGTYANGDIMSLMQDRIGLIGCHPESMEYWYRKSYLRPLWHQGQHHTLLLEFVDNLMQR